MVVQLEEAFFAGDPKIDGPLKDLLTGEEITIERKNIDPITAPNFGHFVVISNAERPVLIKEGSRRYYPIECSSVKANDLGWFDPIRRRDGERRSRGDGLRSVALDPAGGLGVPARVPPGRSRRPDDCGGAVAVGAISPGMGAPGWIWLRVQCAGSGRGPGIRHRNSKRWRRLSRFGRKTT